MTARFFSSLCCVALLLCAAPTLYPQGVVSYTYDANGNRVARILSVEALESMQKSVPDNSDTEASANEISSDVLIYPNPTTGMLKVEIRGDSNWEYIDYSVFSFDGDLLFLNRAQPPLFEIDLTAIPDGTYVLKLTIGLKVSSFKVIKQGF